MSEGLHAQAEAMAPPAKPIPNLSRLSRTEEMLILQLHAEGKTQVAIAQVIGCSQPTVHRVVGAFADTKILAKAVLNKSALALAERVVKRANVAESLEVLERIDVIAPKKQDVGRGVGVNIVIGMPGSPAGHSPSIELSPAPFAPTCIESGHGK